VVGDPESLVNESFSKNLLDTPHYTRPRLWRGKEVPSVLLSGDHRAVREWREKMALAATKKKRPKLLKI
jgi:tRNA (guanine37-N1)-methyltransferase